MWLQEQSRMFRYLLPGTSTVSDTHEFLPNSVCFRAVLASECSTSSLEYECPLPTTSATSMYFSLPIFNHKVRIKLLPIYHSYLGSKNSDRTHVRPKLHPNVLHNRFISSS